MASSEQWRGDRLSTPWLLHCQSTLTHYGAGWMYILRQYIYFLLLVKGRDIHIAIALRRVAYQACGFIIAIGVCYRDYIQYRCHPNGYLDPIPVGIYCCSQFEHGKRATSRVYTQYVRIVSAALDKNGKSMNAIHPAMCSFYSLTICFETGVFNCL